MLLKVGSINAIGVLITSLTSLISFKIIAVLLGAEGMALIGNMRNVLTTIQSGSTLGLYNGIVKYVAQYKTDKKELSAIVSTSFFASLVVVLFLSVYLYFGSEYWNTIIFGEEFDFGYIFKIVAIVLPFYAINTLCLAVVNGFSKYKAYILLNIISSITGLFVTLFLVWKYRIDGAFFAIVLNPAISLLITFYILIKQTAILKSISIHKISFKYLSRFGSYAIMALVSSTILPVILIRIRNFIISVNGVDEAGYWEAMQRISNQYMMFITTLLTLYLLPKLSEVKTNKGFRSEVFNFYKIILPIFALSFIVIYILRSIIIKILFSNDFISMESLFSWQLGGDLFKIASLVIAHQLLAKKMFWHYITTEIISFSILYLLSINLIDQYGFVGASMAYFFNYIFYFFMIIMIFRKQLFGSKIKIR